MYKSSVDPMLLVNERVAAIWPSWCDVSLVVKCRPQQPKIRGKHVLSSCVILNQEKRLWIRSVLLSCCSQTDMIFCGNSRRGSPVNDH